LVIEQAEFYVRQLETGVKAMAAEPPAGRSRDEIRAGYKKYLAGSHVLFFRVAGAGIDVVRILHRHMHFDRAFGVKATGFAKLHLRHVTFAEIAGFT